MTTWPNFLIVGAVRGGTTSLYFYLRKHPDVYMPSVKEPHFFTRFDADPSKTRQIVREEDYLNFFKDAGGKTPIGEASTTYLYDEGAPKRIKATIPEAQIIMVLREPIDRTYSHYLLATSHGKESRPFYEAVWEDYHQPRRGLGVSQSYVEFGLYYEAVKRYLETFNREQIRIYLYDDLVSDVVGLVKDICKFLSVPFYDGRFFNPTEKYNDFASPRNTFMNKQINKRILEARRLQSIVFFLMPRKLLIPIYERLFFNKCPKPPMDPRAREFLRSIYTDDIRKLQGLIARDLSAWLTED